MGFDPYRQWLQISGNPAAPNHYELLGVPLFEGDPARIESAFQGRYARVRKYEAGTHSERAVSLLEELSRAYQCLTNPHSKHRYDQQLRRQRAGQGTQTDVPAMTETQADVPAKAATAQPRKPPVRAEAIQDPPPLPKGASPAPPRQPTLPNIQPTRKPNEQSATGSRPADEPVVAEVLQDIPPSAFQEVLDSVVQPIAEWGRPAARQLARYLAVALLLGWLAIRVIFPDERVSDLDQGQALLARSEAEIPQRPAARRSATGPIGQDGPDHAAGEQQGAGGSSGEDVPEDPAGSERVVSGAGAGFARGSGQGEPEPDAETSLVGTEVTWSGVLDKVSALSVGSTSDGYTVHLLVSRPAATRTRRSFGIQPAPQSAADDEPPAFEAVTTDPAFLREIADYLSRSENLEAADEVIVSGTVRDGQFASVRLDDSLPVVELQWVSKPDDRCRAVVGRQRDGGQFSWTAEELDLVVALRQPGRQVELEATVVDRRYAGEELQLEVEALDRRGVVVLDRDPLKDLLSHLRGGAAVRLSVQVTDQFFPSRLRSSPELRRLEGRDVWWRGEISSSLAARQMREHLEISNDPAQFLGHRFRWSAPYVAHAVESDEVDGNQQVQVSLDMKADAGLVVLQGPLTPETRQFLDALQPGDLLDLECLMTSSGSLEPQLVLTGASCFAQPQTQVEFLPLAAGLQALAAGRGEQAQEIRQIRSIGSSSRYRQRDLLGKSFECSAVYLGHRCGEFGQFGVQVALQCETTSSRSSGQGQPLLVLGRLNDKTRQFLDELSPGKLLDIEVHVTGVAEAQTELFWIASHGQPETKVQFDLPPVFQRLSLMEHAVRQGNWGGFHAWHDTLDTNRLSRAELLYRNKLNGMRIAVAKKLLSQGRQVRQRSPDQFQRLMEQVMRLDPDGDFGKRAQRLLDQD